MTKSLSDSFEFLGVVPRWVWILLFVLSLLFRVWFLVAIIGAGIILFIILWILSIIAIGEIIDDDGPGHRGSGGGIWGWLWR